MEITLRRVARVSPVGALIAWAVGMLRIEDMETESRMSIAKACERFNPAHFMRFLR